MSNFGPLYESRRRRFEELLAEERKKDPWYEKACQQPITWIVFTGLVAAMIFIGVNYLDG